MFFTIRHTHRADHGDLEEKKRVKKFFDAPLSRIGENQAYKIGQKLINEIGRDKNLLFIISPYLRCLQTADLIYAGMIKHHTDIYKKTFFVEDCLKEWQMPENVGEYKNYKNLHFFEKNSHELIEEDIAHNNLNFLDMYRNISDIKFPEGEKGVTIRINKVLEKVQQFSKKNQDFCVLLIGHANLNKVTYKNLYGSFPDTYHYGSVCKYFYNKGNKKWIVDKCDKKYY